MNPSWYGSLPFVSFMAHLFCAYSIVYTFTPAHHWVSAAVCGVTFAKEFLWDKHYEHPGQSFDDDLSDWAGYLTGVILALGMLRWY